MNGDSIQNILSLYRFIDNQTEDKVPKKQKKCLVMYRIKNGYQGHKNEKKYYTI